MEARQQGGLAARQCPPCGAQAWIHCWGYGAHSIFHGKCLLLEGFPQPLSSYVVPEFAGDVEV